MYFQYLKTGFLNLLFVIYLIAIGHSLGILLIVIGIFYFQGFGAVYFTRSKNNQVTTMNEDYEILTRDVNMALMYILIGGSIFILSYIVDTLFNIGFVGITTPLILIVFGFIFTAYGSVTLGMMFSLIRRA